MPHYPARLLALAALGTLTACAAGPSRTAATTAPTALDVWADRVQVSAVPEEIRLAPHVTGLSGTQARALAEFQARWTAAEGGPITIAAPTTGDTAGGYRVGADARAYLIAQGAPADQVRMVGYDPQGEAGAPVVVAFQRYVVATPGCGGWENLARTAGNGSYSNLGCAVSANIAAQVANPADLQGTRPMTPADAGRRATVIGKWRNGEVTSTPKDDQASGAVSTAVQ
ncbi:MAG: CpaD family pilus assembly protein [Pseudomonadota bacterium]